MNRAFCISIDLMSADKPPASLAFLASACEKAEYDYECISVNSLLNEKLARNRLEEIYKILSQTSEINDKIFGPDIDKILEEASQEIFIFKPDIILVSVFSYVQYNLALSFLKKIKNINIDVEIIAGGPGILKKSKNNKTYGKELADIGLVDYYCLGEGDILLVEFLKGNRSQLGLNAKEEKFESWVPQLNDLDQEYLVPSYKKIKTDSYKNLEGKLSTVFPINTSRGCVRSCSFCDVAQIWEKFRYRSGKHVAEEILKHHLEVGAVHFTLVDVLINGSIKGFYDFNLEMIKLKEKHADLSNFSYNGMFIVRNKSAHKEDLFKLMKLAGCESLTIGVETGSDKVRFEMNKKFTNLDLDYHMEMCDKYKIKNCFLMFTGYPTETRQDFEESLKLLERYQKYLINDTLLGINHAGPFSMIKDTPIFKNSNIMGIEFDHHYESSELSWLNTNNLSLDIKERALRDIEFRKRAIELRYPMPYANRYLEYLKEINNSFLLLTD